MLPVFWTGGISCKGLDLSKEVLWVSLGRGPAKLQSFKLWELYHRPGPNPGATRVWCVVGQAAESV